MLYYSCFWLLTWCFHTLQNIAKEEWSKEKYPILIQLIVGILPIQSFPHS
jgi:hypothetical protein